MRNVWNFFSNGRIVFGIGSIGKLNTILQKLNAHNLLLITDPGIKRAGIMDRIVSLLKQASYQVVVYDQVVAEPPVDSAVECLKFVESRMKVDAVIGLGGGSSIDVAKVVALLLAHGGSPLDYSGENKLPGAIAPLIAIPTTAGTGSEVSSVAVLTDRENNLKVGISDNYLRPAVSLLDPELTVGLPPYLTACTGIDALSHAIESFTAKPYSHIEEEDILFQGSAPISDIFSLQAIDLIARNLARAVKNGADLEARSHMLLGSLLAGIAFSNSGTAAAHALAYPIGGLVKSPHGEVTGLLLPYVMEYNADAITEKLVRMAPSFSIRTEGLSAQDIAAAVPDAVLKLLQEINLPTKLSQIGIREQDIPQIAELSQGITRLIRNNPKPPSQQGFEELLRKAL